MTAFSPPGGDAPGSSAAAVAEPTSATAADPLPARVPWSPWREARGDLGVAVGVVAALAVVGVAAGFLWRWLAPRADFRITEDGPVPVGTVNPELLVSDDGVFVLIMVGVGLLAGGAAWLLRRRRGLAVLFAVSLGGVAAAVIAWQLGALLAPRPTEAELADVGRVVTTGLRLGSLPALAVAPFVAVLTYLAPVAWAGTDDLDRDDDRGGDGDQRRDEGSDGLRARPASSSAP